MKISLKVLKISIHFGVKKKKKNSAVGEIHAVLLSRRIWDSGVCQWVNARSELRTAHWNEILGKWRLGASKDFSILPRFQPQSFLFYFSYLMSWVETPETDFFFSNCRSNICATLHPNGETSQVQVPWECGLVLRRSYHSAGTFR